MGDYTGEYYGGYEAGVLGVQSMVGMTAYS